jgi:alpha-tubulin suppressor-like RCC1 family protein
MRFSTFRVWVFSLLLLLAGSAQAQRIAGGNSHTLSIHPDGTLWAWGSNGQGQLGVAGVYYQPTPIQVSTATWQSVAASQAHTLAIRQDGTLWAWGENSVGQLGLGTTASQPTPVQVGTASWQSVAVSYGHTVAVRADGTLWTWGDNSAGQLGTGATSTDAQLTPVQVGTATTWQRVAATGRQSGALRIDGSLWLWGENSDGQLGDGTTTNHLLPTQLSPGTTWQAIALGDTHTLAVRQDGTLWAWGSNYNGQLGTGTTTQLLLPVQVGTATTWQRVAAGSSHSVALRQDGTLWTWGANSYGQLGSGNTNRQSVAVPTQVGTATDWQSIAGAQVNTLALRQNGSLWTWGSNAEGQLGDGSGFQLTPTQVAAPSTWRSVAAGQVFSAGIKTDGTLWTWGYNYYRQLGNGTDEDAQSTPTQISQATTWRVVVAGDNHGLAIREDGTLWAWGSNQYGQVGNGSPFSQLSPVQIGTATWKSVAAGSGHTVAIRQDGTLWAWGQNSTGQLGTGSTQQDVPVQVGTAADWQAVACGATHTLALKMDGSLWTWGNNGNGQLGNGYSTGAPAYVPVRLGTATWVSVAGGYTHSLAVRADGTLWAWGYNTNGQLGTGNTSRSEFAPRQIGAATTWLRVAAGNNSSAALQQDGTLWMWGSNFSGETGNGAASLLPVATPTQVGSARWQTLAVGGSHTLATRLDNTLWAWGYNGGGKLGQPYFAAAPVFILNGGGANSPLTVTLVAFTAQRQGEDGLLTWTTASELHHAHTVVESSGDGKVFRPLGKVAGQGTSAQLHRYQFTDMRLARYAAPLVYYRLKQVDEDSTSTYSPVCTLRVPLAAKLLGQAFPNPSAGAADVYLTISTDQAGPLHLLVLDVVGRPLYQQEAILPVGSTRLLLRGINQLATGVYLLRLQQSSQQCTLKLVRQ